MPKAILVTGATGKQGGAVIKALLAADPEFRILAVTRDETSAAAAKVADKSEHIFLVQGDLDDTDKLFERAQQSTTLPIWGVFSVQGVQMGNEGPLIEERQGKALIDSAIKFGVKHFVYSSVDRHGDASADNKTNVPHFISKYNIEHHLFEHAKDRGMTWTVLRPVAFMENFDGGFVSKVFTSAWKLVLKSRPLQFVATDDIGVFAAKSFTEPEKYAGKCISLAGDELTYEQMQKVFVSKTGAEAPRTLDIIAKGVLWMYTDIGTMFSFFEKEGYGADIQALKKEHPELINLETWLDKKAK